MTSTGWVVGMRIQLSTPGSQCWHFFDKRADAVDYKEYAGEVVRPATLIVGKPKRKAVKRG